VVEKQRTELKLGSGSEPAQLCLGGKGYGVVKVLYGTSYGPTEHHLTKRSASGSPMITSQ